MAKTDVPTLRGCMHALRGSAADRESASSFQGDIAGLMLSDEEWEGFRGGMRDIRKIDLRIDRILDGDLSPQGAFALGLSVALFGKIGLRIQASSPRKAAPVLREAAELIPVAIMALEAGADPDPERVVQRLAGLRAKIDAAGIDTGTFGRAPAISKQDVEAHHARFRVEPAGVPARKLAGVVVGVFALLLVFAAVLLTRGGEDAIDVRLHQDLVPTKEITRHTGEVTLRVPMGWSRDDRPSAEAAAVKVWQREVAASEDGGLKVMFTTGQGRIVATVAHGSVAWTLD